MVKDKIDIIYEDKSIIVVNKPSGLLTISTENEKEKTLFHKVFTYLKQKNKKNKVFIVHRLDKDTSGLIVFAKSEEVKRMLQEQWDNDEVERYYYAIVHGIPEKKQDTIISWLKETKTLYTYSVDKFADGKKAITKYNVISSNNQYSYLSINIITGRKNQIRVHMKDIDHPIVGDRKYGIKDNSRRMLLHEYKLVFKHPKTNETVIYEVKEPKVFELYK